MGAAREGGRFNRPGQEALYLSLEDSTALAEYKQDNPWLQPGTICTSCDRGIRSDSFDLFRRKSLRTWPMVLSAGLDGLIFLGSTIVLVWPSIRKINLRIWRSNDKAGAEVACSPRGSGVRRPERRVFSFPVSVFSRQGRRWGAGLRLEGLRFTHSEAEILRAAEGPPTGGGRGFL